MKLVVYNVPSASASEKPGLQLHAAMAALLCFFDVTFLFILKSFMQGILIIFIPISLLHSPFLALSKLFILVF